MKTAKVKARKIIDYCGRKVSANVQPVFVLPADADSIERMVEQMAQSMFSTRYYCTMNEDPEVKSKYMDLARAALAAIGVKAKGGGK